MFDKIYLAMAVLIVVWATTCDGGRHGSCSAGNVVNSPEIKGPSTKVVSEQRIGIPRTEIVFVSPIPGGSLEFSSDTARTLSRIENGEAPPILFTGENPSGEYVAKAFVNGEEIESWTIQVETGYRVAVTLRIGQKAEVEKKDVLEPLGPIPNIDSAVSPGSDG